MHLKRFLPPGSVISIIAPNLPFFLGFLVLNKIEEVIKDNLRIVGNDERAITDCYEYALEDLRRFRTVVESPNVAATVDNAILMANGKLLALKPDEYTAYM